MLKPQGSYEWEYLLLALDVKGTLCDLAYADSMLTFIRPYPYCSRKTYGEEPIELTWHSVAMNDHCYIHLKTTLISVDRL